MRARMHSNGCIRPDVVSTRVARCVRGLITGASRSIGFAQPIEKQTGIKNIIEIGK